MACSGQRWRSAATLAFLAASASLVAPIGAVRRVTTAIQFRAHGFGVSDGSRASHGGAQVSSILLGNRTYDNGTDDNGSGVSTRYYDMMPLPTHPPVASWMGGNITNHNGTRNITNHNGTHNGTRNGTYDNGTDDNGSGVGTRYYDMMPPPTHPPVATSLPPGFWSWMGGNITNHNGTRNGTNGSGTYYNYVSGAYGSGAHFSGTYHTWQVHQFDPAQDMAPQAFEQLYDPATGALRRLDSVQFVHNGVVDAGQDATGLRREFVSLLADSFKRSDVLTDLYGEGVRRLLPVPFYDLETASFAPVPPPDADRLRFLGAALAQFFVSDTTASSNFLMFELDPRIYAALAEGAVHKPAAAGGQDALEDCDAVADLLRNTDDAASTAKLGPYARRSFGQEGRVWGSEEQYSWVGLTWGDLAPEGAEACGEVAFGEAGGALARACRRYWEEAWETPMGFVLEGWEAQHGKSAAALRGGQTPADFAARLRSLIQRTEPVNLALLVGNVQVMQWSTGGSVEGVEGTVLEALELVRAGGEALRVLADIHGAAWDSSDRGGEARLHGLFRFWSGSPHLDTTKTYTVALTNRDACLHGIRSHTCNFQLDIPRRCFEGFGGGQEVLARALFLAYTLNGDAYGIA